MMPTKDVGCSAEAATVTKNATDKLFLSTLAFTGMP